MIAKKTMRMVHAREAVLTSLGLAGLLCILVTATAAAGVVEASTASTWSVSALDGPGGAGAPGFIETAAYGTPMNDSLVFLRAFRDTLLLTNPPGRFIVGTYYNLQSTGSKSISAER